MEPAELPLVDVDDRLAVGGAGARRQAAVEADALEVLCGGRRVDTAQIVRGSASALGCFKESIGG